MEGEVWAWRVVPVDDAYAGLDILRDIRPDLAVVSEDPFSAGLRVVPGPIGMAASAVAAVSYAATGNWKEAALATAGIALAARGAGAAVVAFKAARATATSGRMIATAAKFAGKAEATLDRVRSAMSSGSSLLRRGANAVGTAAQAAGRFIANGNNFPRVGRQSSGFPLRVSLGPTPKHFGKLGQLGKALSPIHLHIERAKIGIDFNWFKNKSFYWKK